MKIKEILKLLPEGYKEACWETKAMSRRKGIQDEETLLTLCLYYGYDRSLIDTQNYAQSFLSVKISDVGFMKRFIRCNEWLKWMNEHMAIERHEIYDKPEKLKDYRIMAIDASDIESKGAVKQTWRLHYAVNLFTMNSETFKITSEETGESLKNFELQPKDLILADRIYATITGIEHCRKSGAEFILRLRNKAFQLYDKDKNKIILVDLLKNVGDTCCDFDVYYYSNEEKRLKPIRLCAVQKTTEEKEFAKENLRKKESRKQIKYSEDTIFTHDYFFVVTSLDNTFSCKEILDLYRLRWQVEMVFKRFKSILNLGSIPTRTASSSEAWLNCKMLIALLIEKLLSKVDFSPCDQFSEESLERDQNVIPFDFGLLFKCTSV